MFPPDPIVKAWETRKMGSIEKTLVKSARRPWNIIPLNETSFCISRLIFSTVPGFERPRAALRSEKPSYTSLRVAVTALWVRNDQADGAASAILETVNDERSRAVSAQQHKKMLQSVAPAVQLSKKKQDWASMRTFALRSK